jgi:hypothetical protein
MVDGQEALWVADRFANGGNRRPSTHSADRLRRGNHSSGLTLWSGPGYWLFDGELKRIGAKRSLSRSIAQGRKVKCATHSSRRASASHRLRGSQVSSPPAVLEGGGG